MRRLLAVCMILTVGMQQARAECGCGYPSRCQTPCQRCAPQQICVRLPEAACQGPPELAPAPEEGVFAAPPRTGPVVGETEGLGIEGPSIHFPAFSFRMPTVQFPSITRFRTQARMLVEAAEAPYVQQPRYEYTTEVHPAPETIRAVPESVPAPQEKAPCRSEAQPERGCDSPCGTPRRCVPGCTQTEDVLQSRVNELEARERELQMMLGRLQTSLDQLLVVQQHSPAAASPSPFVARPETAAQAGAGSAPITDHVQSPRRGTLVRLPPVIPSQPAVLPSVSQPAPRQVVDVCYEADATVRR